MQRIIYMTNLHMINLRGWTEIRVHYPSIYTGQYSRSPSTGYSDWVALGVINYCFITYQFLKYKEKEAETGGLMRYKLELKYNISD